MVKAYRVASLVVAVGLAVPALAEAQAKPRNSGSSSSGSSSGGGSTARGGSSSSGGGGGVSGSGVSRPTSTGGGQRSPSPANPGTSLTFGSASGRSSSSKGSAKPAPAAPEPGGRAVPSSRSARPGSTEAAASGRRSATNPVIETLIGRMRGGQPVSGLASPRPEHMRGDVVSFPLFGPWGRWYPWFSPGFGGGLGFVTYNPWSYGATSWTWGRYGLWYDPWAYSWDPYWYLGTGTEYGSAAAPRRTTGAIRLKANPSSAKVYIDGALVGLVDEFDGLTDHLELEAGRRVVELRAEGYQTVTTEVTVNAGKTKTVRLSMKKN